MVPASWAKERSGQNSAAKEELQPRSDENRGKGKVKMRIVEENAKFSSIFDLEPSAKDQKDSRQLQPGGRTQTSVRVRVLNRCL